MKRIFYLLLVLSSLGLIELNATAHDQAAKKFEELARKAEERYKSSSDQRDKQEEQKSIQSEEATSESQETGRFGTILNTKKSTYKPVLNNYTEFSPEWWNALFADCKGVEYSDSVIDPEVLLNNNPRWREVEAMNSKAKQLVMKKALDEFYFYKGNNQNNACNLACALCVGCDPNERDSNAHTALHNSQGHYGIFNLLLRKGADPNLLCQPLHPLEFYIPERWKDELRKYGSRFD